MGLRRKRWWWPTMSTTPARSHAASIALHSARLSAIGFSTSTCLPLAAARTGLAVSTHSAASPIGLEHLRILCEEGADPARVAIGHSDSYPFIEYHEALLRSGAYVQFDNIGYRLPLVASLESRLIPVIAELIRRGWAERLLLSQDVCHRSHLKAYGGNGYDYILCCFLGRLRDAGVGEEAIQLMTVDNPRRLLAGE